MELKSLKLKNDCDLLGFVTDESSQFLTISNPILIKIEPREGFFARDWLYLTEEKTVNIDKNDIFYVKKASQRSMEIYDDYKKQNYNVLDDDDITIDEDSDLAEMFETLIESKRSIKH